MRKIRKLQILFMLLTILVNVIVYLRFVKYPQNRTQLFGEELSVLSGEINMENNISQNFTAAGAKLVSMEIFFSTYARENIGETTIAIKNHKQNIFETKINNSLVIDNAYQKIETGQVLLREGQTYCITVSSSIKEGGISAWKDKQGQLVAKVEYEQMFGIEQWICVNVAFGCANYLLCSLWKLLRA